MKEPLFSSRILEQGVGPVLVPLPAAGPTPGRFYRIRKGDTLLEVAKRAYRDGSMEAARRINDSRYNRRFCIAAPASERRMFPAGRISFTPRFTGDLRRQIASVKRAPAGKAFAMIWIPPSGGVEPFWLTGA